MTLDDADNLRVFFSDPSPWDDCAPGSAGSSRSSSPTQAQKRARNLVGSARSRLVNLLKSVQAGKNVSQLTLADILTDPERETIRGKIDDRVVARNGSGIMTGGPGHKPPPRPEPTEEDKFPAGVIVPKFLSTDVVDGNVHILRLAEYQLAWKFNPLDTLRGLKAALVRNGKRASRQVFPSLYDQLREQTYTGAEQPLSPFVARVAEQLELHKRPNVSVLALTPKMTWMYGNYLKYQALREGADIDELSGRLANRARKQDGNFEFDKPISSPGPFLFNACFTVSPVDDTTGLELCIGFGDDADEDMLLYACIDMLTSQTGNARREWLVKMIMHSVLCTFNFSNYVDVLLRGDVEAAKGLIRVQRMPDASSLLKEGAKDVQNDKEVVKNALAKKLGTTGGFAGNAFWSGSANLDEAKAWRKIKGTKGDKSSWPDEEGSTNVAAAASSSAASSAAPAPVEEAPPPAVYVIIAGNYIVVVIGQWEWHYIICLLRWFGLLYSPTVVATPQTNLGLLGEPNASQRSGIDVTRHGIPAVCGEAGARGKTKEFKGKWQSHTLPFLWTLTCLPSKTRSPTPFFPTTPARPHGAYSTIHTRTAAGGDRRIAQRRRLAQGKLCKSWGGVGVGGRAAEQDKQFLRDINTVCSNYKLASIVLF